jgi:hypothetical protein
MLLLMARGLRLSSEEALIVWSFSTPRLASLDPAVPKTLLRKETEFVRGVGIISRAKQC